MSLLELRDLAVTYRTADGPVPAVRGVSLRLDEGQTLGIAGESGCGKSTLAAAVLRLLPRTAKVTGEVLFDGEDVLTMRWGQLRAVRWAGASIVFQGAMHSLNPVQKIGKQIAEPILLHEPKVTPAAAAKRVASLLEQVGLPAWRANGYPHELSGGQKQRIMIAMALACSPNLIIADEPTTALDVMIQAQVLRLITGLVAERGISMIMISHDLSVLSVTCERLAVMYAGRVVEEGPAHEVFTGAQHPYAQALALAFPIIGDERSRLRPRGLAGDPPDPAELPSGCTFHPRCPVAEPECTSVETALWPAGRPGWPPASGSARITPQPARLRQHQVRRPDDRAGEARRSRSRNGRPGDRDAVRGRGGGPVRGPGPPAGRPRGGRGQPGHCRRARSSRWSASPAAARPRWPGPCSAWSGRPRARSGSRASRCPTGPAR